MTDFFPFADWIGARDTAKVKIASRRDCRDPLRNIMLNLSVELHRFGSILKGLGLQCLE
jgi:hypothetical protein